MSELAQLRACGIAGSYKLVPDDMQQMAFYVVVPDSQRDQRLKEKLDPNSIRSKVRARCEKYRTKQKMIWFEEWFEPTMERTMIHVPTREDSPGEIGYSRLKSIVNPDGSWERYEYDDEGRSIKTVRSYKDKLVVADDSKVSVTYYDYTPLDENDNEPQEDCFQPRTIVRKVLDVVVGKDYYHYSSNAVGVRTEIAERCFDPSAPFGDAKNLRTVTVYRPSGTDSPLNGRVTSVQYPDGRLDTYEYDFGSYITDFYPAQNVFVESEGGAALRTRIVHGTVNNPEGIPGKSTIEVSVVDAMGNNVLSETYVYTDTGEHRIDWSVRVFDDNGRITEQHQSNGTFSESQWGCCGKDWEQDETGIERDFFYDDLRRLESAFKHAQQNVETKYTYDADGRRLTTTRTGVRSLVTSSEYDLVGRLVQSVDEAGLVTTYEYLLGGRRTTVTLPGGGATITESYHDGRTKRVSGSAQVGTYHDYGVNADGSQWRTVYTGPDDENSLMRVKTTTDLLGRTIREEKPGFNGTTVVTEYTYNNKGQLVSSTVSTSTSASTTIYEYDELGNQVRSGIDVYDDGLDLDGIDRITETESVYEYGDPGLPSHSLGEGWWQTTVSKVYAAENSDVITTPSIQKRRLTEDHRGHVSTINILA